MSDEVKNADESKAADSESEKESSTLSTIEAKMAGLRGDVKSDDDPHSIDDEKVTSPDPTDTDSDKKDDDSPLLPSGHRRAALARGYTNEEVDHYLKTKPDEAVARLGEIFNEWQKENSVWSERGRQLAGQKVPEKEDGDEKTLSHYDAKALIEAHPESEDLINDLVSPLNAVIDRVKDVAERLSGSEEFLRNTEENALLDATQEFLTSRDMEPFKETYGIEPKDLTDEQVKSRMKLFEQADIIVTGAADHGKEITVRDALERAHIIISQGTRDEAIRVKIRNSLKKRTKTIKSSHQQTSASNTDQPSEEELVKRTEARQRTIMEKK